MSTPAPSDRSAADRLHAELQRLYLPRPGVPGAPGEPPSPATLADAGGRVRALLMQLTGPPDWEPLARVWRGVQLDLDLPAPAVAVSGVDALQLWFSLAEPVAPTQGQALLQGLRRRYLPELPARRLRLLPSADAASPDGQAGVLPALSALPALPVRQVQAGQWSAFVAPDLAPVFAETPWLEGPPNEEGQATLLRGLASITPAVWEQALARLAPAADTGAAADMASNTGTDAAPASAGHGRAIEPPAPQAGSRPPADDPRRFLLQVMNDETVALALRIEAARALLSHDAGPRERG